MILTFPEYSRVSFPESSMNEVENSREDGEEEISEELQESESPGEPFPAGGDVMFDVGFGSDI